MIRLIYLSIFLIVFLNGCASTKGMQEVIIDSKTKTEYVFPDDKYLESCKELSELKGNKPKDLYLWGVDTANQYNSCSQDKDILADWIKRFKNNLNK